MIASQSPSALNAATPSRADFACAGDLACALASLGIIFYRKGDDLALKDPQRLLTPPIVEAVRQHKPELLALVGCEPSSVASAAPLAGNGVSHLPMQRYATVFEPARDDDKSAPDFHSESDFHQGVSDVLRRVAASETPQSHTALMKHLVEAGYGKSAAREAIAETQARGWIEHDLKLGYVLTGGAGETEEVGR